MKIFKLTFLVASLVSTLAVQALEYDSEMFTLEDLLASENSLEYQTPRLKSIAQPIGRRNSSELGRGVDVRPEIIEDLIEKFPVVVRINTAAQGKFSQTVRVYIQGVLHYTWLTSSGLPQFQETLPGVFYPLDIKRCAWSRSYGLAPMHFMVRFNGGIAVHQTSVANYEKLGERASRGCARMRKGNAEFIYNAVLESGRANVALVHRNGQPVMDRAGNPMTSNQWNSLIIVEQSVEGDISERQGILSADLNEEDLKDPSSRTRALRRGTDDWKLCNP
jgi:lipoprotein-anchoring transpeptidase ErfK/SrfK